MTRYVIWRLNDDLGMIIRGKAGFFYAFRFRSTLIFMHSYVSRKTSSSNQNTPYFRYFIPRSLFAWMMPAFRREVLIRACRETFVVIALVRSCKFRRSVKASENALRMHREIVLNPSWRSCTVAHKFLIAFQMPQTQSSQVVLITRSNYRGIIMQADD